MEIGQFAGQRHLKGCNQVLMVNELVGFPKVTK